MGESDMGINDSRIGNRGMPYVSMERNSAGFIVSREYESIWDFDNEMEMLSKEKKIIWAKLCNILTGDLVRSFNAQ